MRQLIGTRDGTLTEMIVWSEPSEVVKGRPELLPSQRAGTDLGVLPMDVGDGDTAGQDPEWVRTCEFGVDHHNLQADKRLALDNDHGGISPEPRVISDVRR